MWYASRSKRLYPAAQLPGPREASPKQSDGKEMFMVPTGPDFQLCLSLAKLLLASDQDIAESPA